MADNAVINRNSKYLLLVNELKFAIEQWLRFENPDGTFPPIPAVHGRDFIAIGAAGDQFGQASDDKTTYDDDFTGNTYDNDSIISANPSINMIGGLEDLKFLLTTFMNDLELQINSKPTSLLSMNVRPTVKSLSGYAGVYSDTETLIRGLQLNEIDMKFNKSDGVIPISLDFMGSKLKVGELKQQSIIEQLRLPPIEGWFVDSIYFKGNDSSNTAADFIENDPSWIPVGCEITEAELDINLNLDEDTGATICGDNINIGESKNLNRFRGELKIGDLPEISYKFTHTQTTQFWKQLELGGVGVAEHMNDYYGAIKMQLINANGAVLILGSPECDFSSDGASLTASKPSEEITAIARKLSGYKMDNASQDLGISGKFFAHFYPDNFFQAQGISFISVITGPLTPEATAMSRWLVNRHADQHLVIISDSIYKTYTGEPVREFKFKLYRGTYDFFIRRAADPQTKVKLADTFVVNETHTFEHPLVINQLNDDTKAAFGNYTVATSVEDVHVSPDPIDVEDYEDKEGENLD